MKSELRRNSQGRCAWPSGWQYVWQVAWAAKICCSERRWGQRALPSAVGTNRHAGPLIADRITFDQHSLVMGGVLGTLQSPVKIIGKSWYTYDSSQRKHTVRTCIQTDAITSSKHGWCSSSDKQSTRGQACRQSCADACRAAKERHMNQISGFPGWRFTNVCSKDCRLACNQPSARVRITEFTTSVHWVTWHACKGCSQSWVLLWQWLNLPCEITRSGWACRATDSLPFVSRLAKIYLIMSGVRW